MKRFLFVLLMFLSFTITIYNVRAQDIHEAVKMKDIQGVQALLKEHPDFINLQDESGRTPLHIAAEAVNFEIVKLLVENGAEVNAKDNSQQIPLHLTAFHGNQEIADYFISEGADVNGLDIRAFSPLHYAIALRKLDVAASLVESGSDVNAKNSYGQSPFDQSVQFGFKELVNLMLEHGATLPVEDPETEAFLHLSASRDLEPLARRMVDNGVDIRSENENGGTLLHSAAEGGMTDFLDVLLERGLDVDALNRYGMTPLHVAALNGNRGSVEILCEHRANLNGRELAGNTPLNLAEANHHTEVVEFLKRRGADDSPARFPTLAGAYLGQKKPGSEQRIFALGIISSMAYEHSAPVFSPDGNEVYWTVLSDRGYIYSMKRVNGIWTKPSLAPFSGEHSDFYPFFSYDGNKLFYASYRPLQEGQRNPGYGIVLWFVEREGDGWSQPKPVGPPVNTGFEFGFSLTRNGTLYFTRGGGSSFDIYRAVFTDGKYTEPEKLPESVNSEHHEDRPFVAPDESYLIFDSARPNASGGSGGLFICFRKPDGTWTDAIYMDEKMHSGSPASFPYVPPDGKYFFFGSRKNGNNDIYWMDANIIEVLRSQTSDDKEDNYLGQSPPGLTPEVFALGIVSTEYRDHSDVLFLPDADEVYWSFVIDAKQGGILVSRLEDGKWTQPDYPSFSSSDFRDCIVTFWPEQRRLFYCSTRPMEKGKEGGDFNIWYVDRVGDDWSEPKPLSAPINGPGHDSNPAIAQDGTLYFSSDRGGEEWYAYDIFKCEFVDGQFTEPQPLSESINTEYGEMVTFVAPDESYLIFTSFGNPDGLPYGEIFISFRNEDDTWSKAKNMGETINTGKGAGGGYVSSDGKYFFFINENQDNGDVHWVDVKIIEALQRDNRKGE